MHGLAYTRHPGLMKTLKQAGFVHRLPMHISEASVADNFANFPDNMPVAGIFTLGLIDRISQANCCSRKVFVFERDPLDGDSEGKEHSARQLLLANPRLVEYKVNRILCSFSNTAGNHVLVRSGYYKSAIAEWLNQNRVDVENVDGPKVDSAANSLIKEGEVIDVVGYFTPKQAVEWCKYSNVRMWNFSIPDMPVEARGKPLMWDDLANYGGCLQQYHVCKVDEFVPKAWQMAQKAVA